jgi:hypothetical protein
MQIHVCVTALASLVCMAFSDATQTKPGPSDPEVWKSQRVHARQGWQALQKSVQSTGLRGSYRYHRSSTVDGKARPELAFDFEFGTTSNEMYIKKIQADGVKIRGINTNYAFDIARESPESSFVLGDLRRGPLRVRMQDQLSGLWQPLVNAGFQVAGTTMSDLVSSDRFTLVSFKMDDAGRTATLAFQCSSPRESDPKEAWRRDRVSLSGGTITFATDKQWAIASFDCTDPAARYEGKINYRSIAGGLIPVSFESRITGNNQVGVETYEMKEVERLASDVHLPVRLGDYGLAEPVAKLTPAGRTFRQMLVMNLALVSILAVAYYLRRRSRGSQPEADRAVPQAGSNPSYT